MEDFLLEWLWVFQSWTFPFEKPSSYGTTWRHPGTRFGSPRPRPSSGKPITRAHAGADILKLHKTPILAIADGDVLFVERRFTNHDDDRFDTDAVWVDHGTFVIRYGEIEPGSAIDGNGKKIPVGKLAPEYGSIAQVKQGKPLAKVGFVGTPQMLHFEIYYGDQPISKNLTDRSNTGKKAYYPYVPHTYTDRRFQRRSDLLDPTVFLNIMAVNSGFDVPGFTMPQFEPAG